ncbi:TetR/AcrR family transcriptional regulator [Flavobacterium sp. WV_118_3]|uniref:TetR/AcrR family transcriptional regulator n=1 Tax=Flavobacterium sp. WV_118_3 TaxID=3151764 RepID=UPI0012C70C0E|nr:TetR/AcrR family transcriptional regulator [Flavobacterium sp.]HRB70575.1 TetR/AcrR family transcriptional regulator [Flavobacterium sp.]
MKNEILEKASDMFLNLGFKSVTMDDIASEMGISKKTIYEHYATKVELVKAATTYLFEKISSGIDEICALGKNPIEELFDIKDYVQHNIKEENSSTIFQLQKYYPKIHDCLKSLQFEKMDTCVINNLNRGKEAGLFRQEIDVDFIGRIYYASAMSTMDIELFPEKMYTRKELDEKLLEYHVRGIATPKGLETLEKLLINQ